MSNLPFFLRRVASPDGPRPPMFVLLCVLSFIGSGLSAFLYFVMAINFDFVVGQFESGEIVMPQLELFLTGGMSFFLLESILNALAFVGVRLMWQRKLVGFHLYTAAQVFLALVPVAFLEGRPFMIADTFLSGAFVLLYYMQLRRFGLFNSQSGSSDINS